MNVDERRRWIGFGLVASLLLNVFLLGFVVARLSGPPRPPRPRDRRPEVGQQFRAPGPGPMRAIMEGHRDELRGGRAQIHRARGAVRDALLADPFEPARLETALGELRQATHDAQEALHEALLEAAPNLSADERAQLSRAHRLWRGPRGHRRPHR